MRRSSHRARIAPLLALTVLAVGPRLAPAARALAQRAGGDVEAAVARGEAAVARGDYPSAETDLRSALEGPLAARARLGLARVQLATGRYDEAATLAREAGALAGATERGLASTLEGEALLLRGRIDPAIALFREAARDPRAFRARALLGRALLRVGRRAEARPVLMELVRAYNDDVIGPRDAEGLLYVGMAAAMLGSPHDANDAFTQSSRADRRRVETQLEWASLYLSHYDAGHAEECLRDAIAAGPNDARVHVLAARVALAQGFDFDRALAETDAALAIDPATPAARSIRASIALRSLDLVGADAELALALATDPNDLEALSLRAAARFLADDRRGFERAVRAALAVNPTYSELYTVVAEHADWEHRYPDIVRLAEAALTLDPSDARAMATRGMNLLRLGREEDGIAQLRAAFRRDRFNVRVFNTLNLWDDVITPHYEWVEGRSVRLRVHRDERALLAPLALPHLEATFADMRRRYGFTPETPVHVELFASPQHFSVRTEGLPNLGVQGVCFGRVLTALSPRAAEVDWGEVTTHELAHVFHIQLSRNHVPRWFTEGLAEYEASRARPEWRREIDPALARALSSGTLPPLARMNEAFTHARDAEAVMTAYYASARLAAYLVDRFGFAAIPRMLRAWGEGRPSADVVRRALRVSIEALDHDWRAAEEARLSPYTEHLDVDVDPRGLERLEADATARPSDAALRARLGATRLAAGHDAEGASELEAALRLDPHEPVAHLVLGERALARRDAHVALAHVDELLAQRHDGPRVALLEARAALALGLGPRARAALERATRLSPSDVVPWRGLASMAEEDGDATRREAALARIVALDQHDRRSLTALVELLAARRAFPELLALAPRVRFLDPYGARSALRIAEAAVELGERPAAVEAADRALLVAGTSAEAAEAARALRERAGRLATR